MVTMLAILLYKSTLLILLKRTNTANNNYLSSTVIKFALLYYLVSLTVNRGKTQGKMDKIHHNLMSLSAVTNAST